MFDCSKICIDKESTEPLHIQLIRELRRLIREMNQEEYDVLPSERSLCSYLKLHRSTVHKAYQELQDSGIVSRRLNKSLIPNASARKRLEGHLPAIGIIIPYRFSKFIETRKNAIHYLKGIFDRAAERGYAVLLLELPPPETPVEERKYFISTHVSGLTGVLLLGDRKIDNDLMMSELFHYTGIPMVALAGEVDLPHIGSVQCRFDRAAVDMAEYFKNQGVHSLGIIAPPRYRNPLREFNYAARQRTDIMMRIFKKAVWICRSSGFCRMIFPERNSGRKICRTVSGATMMNLPGNCLKYLLQTRSAARSMSAVLMRQFPIRKS